MHFLTALCVLEILNAAVLNLVILRPNVKKVTAEMTFNFAKSDVFTGFSPLDFLQLHSLLANETKCNQCEKICFNWLLRFLFCNFRRFASFSDIHLYTSCDDVAERTQIINTLPTRSRSYLSNGYFIYFSP